MNTYTYEEIDTGLNKIILRSDGACIPVNLENIDYQEYLISISKSTGGKN